MAITPATNATYSAPSSCRSSRTSRGTTPPCERMRMYRHAPQPAARPARTRQSPRRSRRGAKRHGCSSDGIRRDCITASVARARPGPLRTTRARRRGRRRTSRAPRCAPGDSRWCDRPRATRAPAPRSRRSARTAGASFSSHTFMHCCAHNAASAGWPAASRLRASRYSARSSSSQVPALRQNASPPRAAATMPSVSAAVRSTFSSSAADRLLPPMASARNAGEPAGSDGARRTASAYASSARRTRCARSARPPRPQARTRDPRRRSADAAPASPPTKRSAATLRVTMPPTAGASL